MARKRSIFFHAVQSILRSRFRYQHRQKLAALFLALFTLIFSLIVPAIKVVAFESKLQPTFITSNALKLEQQGKDYYDAGRFAEAAETWQQAADAYGTNEDDKNKNLINKAKALQSLGLYPEACSQLMQAFGNLNLTCKELINKDNKDNNQNFIKNLKSKPNVLNKIIGLRLLGEILQRFGELDLSEQILKISWQASEQYPQEKSASQLALGNLERAIGNKKRDELDYEKIINSIDEKCEPKEKCQKQKEEILGLYEPAFQHYKEAAKPQAELITITQIQAELNQLSLRIEMQAWWDEQIEKHQDLLNRQLNRQKDFLVKQLDTSEESKQRLGDIQEKLNTIVKVKDLLPQIESHLGNLSQSREKVYAQINFTHNLINLKSNNNKDYFSQQEIAKFLSNAIQQARRLKDKQAEAAALSNLARLYELQVSDREKLTEQEQLYLAQAKSLTQEAIKLYSDINVDNRQVLYRQRSQLGRILKAQGDIKAALASYAEAWNILQSLRGDLVTNADNQFAFRQDVEPVYREFIDLLLQPQISQIDVEKLVLLNNIPGADIAEGETPKNPLDIARLVMESLQLAELDNFFQEPCSPPIAKPVQIANIDRSTAVIYPIILEHRLEVIVSQSGQSHLYPQKIPKKEVKNTLEDLANIIYNDKVEPDSAINIVTTSKNELELTSNKEKILKLSQKIYNWLIPLELEQQLTQEKIKTLVFVLDRPFQKIPIAALYDGKNYLVEKYNIVLNLGQQLIQPKPLKPENIRILAAGVSKRASARKQEFQALENVETELNIIKDNSKKLRVPYEELRNGDFNKKNLQEKIKSSPNVLHLATHGVFSSNREQTFILTGDNNSIGIDEFRNLLNPKDRIRNRNIELLVLSACQTASGDERAALGIAGVVLRSGASSTIATLWNVSDAATAKLMEEFYKNLTNRDKKMTRAEALRSAQVSLLRNNKYNHPLYWAPFILAGNWI